MRHNFFYDGFHSTSGIVITALIIIAVIAVIMIVLNLTRKNRTIGKGLDEKQKEALQNFSGLVCAMLAQQGNGLKQNEICSNLGLPLEIVAEQLNEMEAEGIITRRWENDDYTFVIDRS